MLREPDARGQSLSQQKEMVSQKITAGVRSLQAGKGCEGEAFFARLMKCLKSAREE